MNKNHILKFAEKHEFIGDGDLCLASYFGRLVLGLVKVDPDSQSMFSDTKTVVIKQNQFDINLTFIQYFKCPHLVKFQ